MAPFQIINSATGGSLRLAMQELQLSGRLTPVGAQLRVQHLFRSAEARPVEVVYAFALPRDAALRRFWIRGERFSIDSELKPTQRAEEDYEQALEQGHLASLARAYRDGMVNLAVGNLHPRETVWVDLEILAGVEMFDEGWRFRFPFTVAPAFHPRTRAVESRAGVGELELPEEFEGVMLPPWMREAKELHHVDFELEIRSPVPVRAIGSPSHPIVVEQVDAQAMKVRLASESDVPNRDLVLDVKGRQVLSGVVGGAASEGTGGFAVIVPSTAFGKPAWEARRVVFVLDRSGSMEGRPIQQARRALEACLGACSEQDRFNVLAFDEMVEVFASDFQPATASGREAARKCLRTIDARGGTCLLSGLRRGIELLGAEGGELLVITDGQVYATEDILAGIPRNGVRIHCLGIGSASQDRFLALLARWTGGQCRFLTPRERVDLAVLELFANLGKALAEGLEAELLNGAGCRLVSPPPPRVFSGTPLVLHVEADGPTCATLTLRWHAEGRLRTKQIPLNLVANPEAAAVQLLQGARLITEMESTMGTPEGKAVGGVGHPLLGNLEALSKRYGLASRAMALVAVVRRPQDQPGQPPQTMVVPVGLPQDLKFDAYFRVPNRYACMAPHVLPDRGAFRKKSARASRKSSCQSSSDVGGTIVDNLLELAAQIEPDGGMSGADEEQRWFASALLLCCLLFLRDRDGLRAFDCHIDRLTRFLESSSVTAADPQKREWLDQLLRRVINPGLPRGLVSRLRRRGCVDQAEFWRALGC